MFETLQGRAAGAVVPDDVVLAAHPELLPELAIELAKVKSIVGALDQAEDVRCSEALSRLRSDWSSDRRAEDSGLSETTDFAPGPAPLAQLGRYRIDRMLGTGGFGVVYLAHDDELKRQVAIKVPRTKRLSRPEEMADFTAEARLVAALDHPAIVPVYDAGRTADGVCFVVSKFIAGTDLAHRMKAERLTHDAAMPNGERWYKRCGSATAIGCSACCWCATIFGWA